jgi:hypothetical protein
MLISTLLDDCGHSPGLDRFGGVRAVLEGPLNLTDPARALSGACSVSLRDFMLCLGLILAVSCLPHAVVRQLLVHPQTVMGCHVKISRA